MRDDRKFYYIQRREIPKKTQSRFKKMIQQLLFCVLFGVIYSHDCKLQV